jgi:hypothetical protein
VLRNPSRRLVSGGAGTHDVEGSGGEFLLDRKKRLTVPCFFYSAHCLGPTHYVDSTTVNRERIGREVERLTTSRMLGASQIGCIAFVTEHTPCITNLRRTRRRGEEQSHMGEMAVKKGNGKKMEEGKTSL